MNKNIFRFLTLVAGITCSLNSMSAFAHFGHLGDLAGHSHGVGVVCGGLAVGLAVGLAGILVAIGKARKIDDNKANGADAPDDGAENPDMTDGSEQYA